MSKANTYICEQSHELENFRNNDEFSEIERLAKHSESISETKNEIQIESIKKLRGCNQKLSIIGIAILVILFIIFILILGVFLLSNQPKTLQHNQNRQKLSSELKQVNEVQPLNEQKKIQKIQRDQHHEEQQQVTIDLQKLKTSNTKLISKIQQLEKMSFKQDNQFELGKKFRVRSHFRDKVSDISDRDHYEFSFPIDKIVSQSSINLLYSDRQPQWSGIKKTEFQRAIKLLEVTHNVNFNGEFVFDHYENYLSAEKKYETLSRLLKQEKEYLDGKYQINEYIHNQIGICVYVPSYNNAKTRLYLRNLDSIFQQEYKNYHLVYVNDASTDGTGEYVNAYMEENEIRPEKYIVVNNEQNKGNCANVYMAAHNFCKEGEIMVFLDGDDALIGRQVFSLLNAVYQKEKVGLVYSQSLVIRQNKISGGFSRKIPHQILNKGTFRSLQAFYSSHLKSMYVDVMRQVKMEDLQYKNGTFLDSASDVAYMTSAIELVGDKLRFLRELTYEYRSDTGLNEGVQKQKLVEAEVYSKVPSSKIINFNFSDHPKTVHYE